MIQDIRDYQSAVTALNGLQSNASNISELNKNRSHYFKLSIPEMNEYLALIGYKPEDLNRLNVIHITGTKGKGSTSAFCNNILRNYDNGSIKTGLFTSPHLMEVRERIRIDGQPLSTSKFTSYFYHCYDRLVNAKISNIHPHLPGPSYFRFLTLMAFHTFIQEKVSATILEVGIGGEYDSTNLVPQPVVCGITHLGLDHMDILGDTIQSIAWHKAGILKPNVPGVTVPNQQKVAEEVLYNRAKEKNSDLTICKSIGNYQFDTPFKLKMAGSHQLENASLAVTLCDVWLQRVKNQPPIHTQLPQFMNLGLINTTWPGRSHQYNDSNNNTWYLDGAHTTESIQAGAQWFQQVIDKSRPIILLFNPAKGRDGPQLLTVLGQELSRHKIKIGALALCPNIIKQRPMDGDKDDNHNVGLVKDEQLKLQHELEKLWSNNYPETKEIGVKPSIHDAISWIQEVSKKISPSQPLQILVTGSLHLVGGVMTDLGHPVV